MRLSNNYTLVKSRKNTCGFKKKKALILQGLLFLTILKMSTNEGKHVLVTGGMGYIGSHTIVQLVDAGWKVTIVDNLSNSR